jgi:DNA topoisomerase-2
MGIINLKKFIYRINVEPVYYFPILPLILINGCEGIGTGWSTSIPSHNPRIIA